LKIIEEPPEHLLFILATTELHKVPATILSRCQRFAFRRISQEDIAERLQYVAYHENIDLDESAARVLARMADGGMRDGLSLLDQCASATVGELTAERVYACLGIAGERRAAELMGYIANHDTAKALALLNKLYSEGKELGALLDELACLARDLLVLKTAPDAGLSMLSGVASDKEAATLAKQLSSGELVQIMEQLEATMAGFSRSASRRVDAELCLIRLCQPELQMDAQSLNARLTRMEEQLRSGSFVASAPVAQVIPETPSEEKPNAPVVEEKPKAQEEAPSDTATTPVGFWADLIAAIKPELKPTTRGFLTTGDNASVCFVLRNDQVVLRCNSDFVKREIDTPETLAMIGHKASALLGRNVTAKAEDINARPEASGKMERLMDFGRAHSDIVKIKEN
jgi:DNA polymerase-3 subunit gamma/tau